MNNFDSSFLAELKSKTNELHQILAASSNWVEDNLAHEEKDSLQTLIKSTKAEVYTINKSVDTKPVFALFGQSQVGKSYLVKNLLTADGKSFEIEFPDNNYVDFLQEINPVGGGAESTGVVTRFSTSASYKVKEFPVKVSLLDVKDIILILCDSFFSDLVKISNYPSAEEFRNHVQSFQPLNKDGGAKQQFLTEDHIYLIKKYFEHNFVRHSHYVDAINASNFWLTVSTLIEKIEPHRWTSLFEILWSKNPTFTRLFDKLINALQLLKFNDHVYVEPNTILRNGGKILDVDRVKGIFSKEELIKVSLPHIEVVNIDVHQLSAVTAEITMPLNPKISESKTFLSNTDLLDFPGARSRQQLHTEHLNEESVPMCLLRGKISYLFNKYSSNYEINNLLFCLKNDKNEVGEIPQLLNDWIETNVGYDPDEREKRIGKNGTSPLFIVFTFYNNSLQFNPNSDKGDLTAKWNNRFIKFFKDETVTTKFNWDDHWTTSEPNFKSFYLLRDFEFSQDVFAGFAANGKETGIVPERVEYMERLKDSFMKFPYINQHFHNPEVAWQASSTPNNDGSERIINDLSPAANNLIKTKNYLSRLIKFKASVSDKLSEYVHSDDIQVQRNKAVEEGRNIRDQLRKLFGTDNAVFGKFLSELYISDTVAYNFIHENYLPASKDHTPSRSEVIIRTYGLDLNRSEKENKIILKEKLGVDSESDVDDWLAKNDIDLSVVLQNIHITAASKLVDGVIDIWKEKLQNGSITAYEPLGLDVLTMRSIIDNLFRTFEIFEVRNKLILIFERKTRLMRVSNDTDEYLASIISSYINDFVSNFGFNFMSDERKNQVIELAGQYKVDTRLLLFDASDLNETDIQRYFEEDDSSNTLTITYPSVEHYMSFITKIQLILLSNCGFRSYNIAENERLSTIMSNLNTLNFN
jgi:hypothetical protein